MKNTYKHLLILLSLCFYSDQYLNAQQKQDNLMVLPSEITGTLPLIHFINETLEELGCSNRSILQNKNHQAYISVGCHIKKILVTDSTYLSKSLSKSEPNYEVLIEDVATGRVSVKVFYLCRDTEELSIDLFCRSTPKDGIYSSYGQDDSINLTHIFKFSLR